MGVFYNNPKVVTDGLILCLDAANPRSYSGIGSSWVNLITGTGYNITGNYSYEVSTVPSIVFDGTVTVPTIDMSAFTNLTIEMWIYDTRSFGDRDILTYNGNGGSYSFNGSNFRTDGNGRGGRIVNAVGQPPLNTWYHFCYVKNSSLYLNTQEFTGINADHPYSTISFGNSRSDVNNKLNGRISNIKIYNRSLSNVEITQNFNTLKLRYGL